jgi:hypothetical protein
LSIYNQRIPTMHATPKFVGWVMLVLLPIILLYLWQQRQEQRKQAARPSRIPPEVVIAQFKKQEERAIRVVGLALLLAALSGLIAYLARNGPDAVFIAAAIGTLAFFGFAAAYSGFAHRCPVCNSPVSANDRFIIHISGADAFPESCPRCGVRLRR